ncbi:hypothetical protein HanPI659440_Chr07g0256021 [Helianthus annuus]|nr:hypothetical protein HanPI659440_Chr07g0256021 [Helianthus annuus]
MTDRIHPSSKPNNTTVTNTTIKSPKLPLPPAKAQLYNQNAPKLPLPPAKAHLYDQKGRPYKQNKTNSNKECHNIFRRCFCLCCFWSILITILILLLAIISGTILYLLYRPHRPTFHVTSLRISRFNLSTTSDGTTHLTSNLNLTLSTKNPNNKIIFHYDPIAIACLTDETELASGYFNNSFTSVANNITIIRFSLRSDAVLLETEAVNRIRMDMKKKLGLRLKLLLDTHAIVKVESFRSKKVGIRIKCEGIRSVIPKSRGAGLNSSSSLSSSSVFARVADAKCEVDLRIKIWKWTF